MKKHIHKFKPFAFRSIDEFPNSGNPYPRDYLILTCECGEVKKEKLIV